MTGQALPERNVVLFYREGEDFGGFSNFSKHPFTVQASSGREFHAATSEHFFQAMKFWTRDPEFAETILATRSAKEAAELGRDRKHPLRGDWEQIKDDVMRLAVATKIGQHADLASQLLGTSESKLVENAPHDSYWGNGHELGGKGKNRLGEILEEVRAELRKGCLDEYAARAAERIGI
ncbi:MAG: NADAR family protein [Deltaproteobacteria bacterium]|nr:NADAR family protein [Deltaproteobacteria bacterium]